GTTLMVDDWYERLGLNEIIGRHKSKGIALDALYTVHGLIGPSKPLHSSDRSPEPRSLDGSTPSHAPSV
ncbi:MAG TPA: hypothetical protein PLY24_00005, partial [Methanomassiliicoccales archaeon]|nr:hypothetical protein [Methanomassiliicoccales archaeon]